jgi:tetratricopeptide (TPR) repeat protein
MFYSPGKLEEPERAARQSVELQSDYLFGLWNLGVALSSLGRHEEAIQTLERAAKLSRSPMFVGLLGLAYARAGRTDDATRLLHELEDCGSRGEYVPAFASLTILIGLGDVTMIRQALAAAMAEQTPPLSLRANGGGLLLDEHRTDPEIDRMLRELHGY